MYLRANMVTIPKYNRCLSTWLQVILLYTNTLAASNNIDYANVDDDGIVQSSVQNGQAQYEIINRDASMPRYDINLFNLITCKINMGK